jgi:peptidoglycan biosynthesis protein MviN/MurJ (putative lipid II flippase)
MRPARRKPWQLATERGRRIRALGSTAALILVARALGLVSQAVIVARLGASASLDAFLIALIPVSLLSVPLVAALELLWAPSYTVARGGDALSATAVRRGFLRRASLLGTGFAVVATLASPILVLICSPGASSSVHEDATRLALLTLPSILPAIVGGAGAAILFGAGKVQVPALVQVIRPIAMLAGAAFLAPGGDALPLAIAMLVGTLLEAATVWSAVALLEGRVTWRGTATAPPSKGFVALVSSNGVLQLTPAIDQAVAAGLGPGSLVILSLATRFYDVAKAALVQPSARLAQTRLALGAETGDLLSSLRIEIRRGLKVGALAAGVLALGGPLTIMLVFTNAAFTWSDARTTAGLVLVFALALIPFSVATILPRALVIANRTGAVFRLYAAYVALNLVGDLVLGHLLGVTGIALATLVALVVLVVLQSRVITAAGSSFTLPTTTGAVAPVFDDETAL